MLASPSVGALRSSTERPPYQASTSTLFAPVHPRPMYLVKALLLQEDKTTADSNVHSTPLIRPPVQPQLPAPRSRDNMDIFGVAPANRPGSQPAVRKDPSPAQPAARPTPAATSAPSAADGMSGFPTLVPAIVTKVNIGEAQPLGTIHNGSNMIHFGTPSGTIESVSGFEPAFKATVNFGADWLSFDPDGQYARINLKGMAKTDEGHAIDFRYKGVIRTEPDVMKIFNMSPDMATVPFGYATGAHTFVVADPKLKELENSTFVSNGRIVVSPEGLLVETRQSQVIPATTMN